jgi:hypothetical protein
MEKNKKHNTKELNQNLPTKRPEKDLVDKEVTVILNSDAKVKATIFGVRYSKGKIHYDLNVFTDKGVIPFYNIDSKIVKF